MGAIKSNDNYTEEDWNLSLIGRAIAHPARIQIIKTLRKHRHYRNIDFALELNMTAASVNEHIEKLKDAELVGIKYHPHFYRISLNPKKLDTLVHFIRDNY